MKRTPSGHKCGCNNVLKEAKQQYFDRIFTAYRTDLKKTWRTISETLCRNKKHCDVPSRFFHDGKELSEPKAIVNAFNVYFANIYRQKFSSNN